jgi:diacylglycerol kinase family enzyme
MAEKVVFRSTGRALPEAVPAFSGEANEAIAVRTVVLIFNPFSGPSNNGSQMVETVIAPMLKAANIEVRMMKTEHKAHAIELARTVKIKGVDGLLVLGGDGTFSAVLTGLKLRADGALPPLGLLPGGTGNNFCRHYLIEDRSASAVAMR